MKFTIAGMQFDGSWFAQGSVMAYSLANGTLMMIVERTPGNPEVVMREDVASLLTSKETL